MLKSYLNLFCFYSSVRFGVWRALRRVDLISGVLTVRAFDKERESLTCWRLYETQKKTHRKRIKTCWVGLGAVQACLSAAQSGQEHIIGVLGRSARAFVLAACGRWAGRGSALLYGTELFSVSTGAFKAQKCFVKFKPAAQESCKCPPECLDLSSKLPGMRLYLEPKIHLWSI